MYSDDEILKEYLKEIDKKRQEVSDWEREESYPHANYDYSIDDFDDYEYQQDIN